MSLKYGAVPVVLGARKEDYTRVAPPNSFIHVGDFAKMNDLASYLELVGNNNTLYRKFHEWRKLGEVVPTFPFRPPELCRTIPFIHRREPNEFKYLGKSPWFKGCRLEPIYKLVRKPSTSLQNWSVWR